MIIGLTGRNGSGKGAVADYLKEQGFEYHSLSDIIRDEIRGEGREVCRENLIEMGRRLRENGGPSVLAVRALEKINSDDLVIVDSIRNPEEVKALRNTGSFFLWQVVADREVRFERCVMRGRENDPQTLEEFIRLEDAELVSENPAAQQLVATEKMADQVLDNSTSLQDLHEKIRELLALLTEKA